MVLIGAAIKSILQYLSRTRGDTDRKWSVHYTTQKPQQGLVFIPARTRSPRTRSSSSHDLSTGNPACDQLTQRGSKLRPPSSSSSGFDQSESSRGWRAKSRTMSSGFSNEDEQFILNHRPLTPLVLDPVPRSWSSEVYDPPEVDPPRLPTPEERMRWQAEAVPADLVPINITGESFDRQASFRKVATADLLPRQPHHLNRRKTVTGVTDDVTPEPDPPLMVLPGQFSTVGRPASSCASSCADQEDLAPRGKSSTRRIRAPRGSGLSSLMASLTTSPPVASSEVHGLPRLGTSSSLSSSSSSSTSSRTLSASSSCGLQGFPRVVPQSQSTSSPWSYQGPHYCSSSSSITESLDLVHIKTRTSP